MSADPGSTAVDIDSMVQSILASRKYRHAGLCPDTVEAVLREALAEHPKPKAAIQVARERLHNIVAPYLGDPDYSQASETIAHSFQPGSSLEEQKAACRALLGQHASTRERLAILDEFYPRLFALTGTPGVILDLACGLNPLTCLWLPQPGPKAYLGFDIHGPRVDMLNTFFQYSPVPGQVYQQDILVHPPKITGDMAMILKEVHRLEQRQPGSSLRLMQALQVRYLAVSFPTRNLTGQRSLANSYRQMFKKILTGVPWEMQEIEFENEMVIVVQKE